MSTLLTNVETVITNLVSWLGSVASGLINNPIFQIMLAVILFILFFGLMVDLAKNVKNERNKKEIENMPYYNLDENIEIDDDYEIADYNELMSSKYDDDEYDEYLNSLNGHNDI